MIYAYITIVSFAVLAVFWFGFWTGQDDSKEFWPKGPAVLLNIACIVGFFTGVANMVIHFLNR
jgi:hypothetical protein